MASHSNASNLSPRDRFQNSVRNLTADDIRRHRRNKSISLNYNPYELQHVSSLRVSPVRRMPGRTGPTTLREVRQPDFGTQERNVWSTTSPTTENHDEFIASPNQYRDYHSALPPLCPHVTIESTTDDRPKTRRGPADTSAFDTLANTSTDNNNEDALSIRPPKFVEGTMTSRSSAVASTWSESEYASSSEAEETDAEDTPKPGQRRRSSSIDLRDFQPPQSTPSGLRRTLFGRRAGKKDPKPEAEKNPKPTAAVDDEQVKRPRRRLRKSISKLQFLGDKMKLFGSSSHDLSERGVENPNQIYIREKSVLDERKRKAEAAYAQQFGLKKQRDNQGAATVTSSSESESINVEEFGGNQKYDSSTVRCRGTTHSRRVSTGSMHNTISLSRQGSINDHDVRKRPSRRELEKENEHLRALLRGSQVVKEQEVDQVLGYASEPEPLPPVPPLRIRRSQPASVPTQPAPLSSFVISQDSSEQVPPLPPQHPDRRSVLGNVSNLHNRRVFRDTPNSVTDAISKVQDEKIIGIDPLQNVPKLLPPLPEKHRPVAPRHSIPALPRSVSMIVEEPENEADEKKRSLRSRTRAGGKENSDMLSNTVTHDYNTRSNTHRDQWEWPEDVF